jgi:hypothetical protein
MALHSFIDLSLKEEISIDDLPSDVILNVWSMHRFPLTLAVVSKKWQHLAQLMAQRRLTIYIGLSISPNGHFFGFRMLKMGVVKVLNITHGHLHQVLKDDPVLKETFVKFPDQETYSTTIIDENIPWIIDQLQMKEHRCSGWYNKMWSTIKPHLVDFKYQDIKKERRQTIINDDETMECRMIPAPPQDVIDLTSDDSSESSDSNCDFPCSKRVKFNNTIDLR